MKIVVAYKWAADYQEARVNSHGDVDWSRARPAVSEYDAVAMEVARRVANATSGEVIGLCVGGQAAGSAIATKTALARGLDRTVVVVDEALPDAGTTQIAETLAKAIQHIGDVDLVLAGDSSIDVAAKMVSSVLAGWLGWPALTDVAVVEADDQGLRLTRPMAGGAETFRVSGPAVVALSADAVQPRTPGMKDILAAGKKPVERLDLAALGVSESTPYAVRERARPQRAARKQQVIDASDETQAANELVGILRNAGVL